MKREPLMRTRLLLLGILAVVFVSARLAPAADPPVAPDKEAKSDAQPKPAEKSAENPVERDVIVAHVEGGYEIDFDVTETPELKEWVKSKLQPACVEWY